MAEALNRGDKQLPLNISSGRVLILKSTIFNLTGDTKSENYLDLDNKTNDTILRITFRKGQKRVFFNDHAFKSIGDGWGKERSADLGPMDVDGWKYRGVTISVHAVSGRGCSGLRYQILFDLTTVCYFDSRFSGPVTGLRYTENTWEPGILSSSLNVVSYAIWDLQPEERRAIESGR
jgi:hypothetical protein